MDYTVDFYTNGLIFPTPTQPRISFEHTIVLDLNVEDIEDENGEEFNEDINMERDRLRMGQQKRNYICNNLLQYSFYKLYIFIKEDLVRTKNILNI
jgi:hypothetical protein